MAYTTPVGAGTPSVLGVKFARTTSSWVWKVLVLAGTGFGSTVGLVVLAARRGRGAEADAGDALND